MHVYNNTKRSVPLFISKTTVQLSSHLNWNYETVLNIEIILLMLPRGPFHSKQVN